MSCDKVGGMFGRCDFKPRYSEEAPTDELCEIISNIDEVTTADLALLVIRKTYIHDVCVTCGKIASKD